MKINFDTFRKERDEALLSLDRKKIEQYARKYGVSLPSDALTFWASIHKARLEIINMPDDAKEQSRQWLRRNGFKTLTGENP